MCVIITASKERKRFIATVHVSLWKNWNGFHRTVQISHPPVTGASPNLFSQLHPRYISLIQSTVIQEFSLPLCYLTFLVYLILYEVNFILPMIGDVTHLLQKLNKLDSICDVSRQILNN